MNKLLTLGLAAFFVMGMSLTFADGHGGKGQGGFKGMDRMSEYLDLSEEQEDQLLELRQDREKEMLERRQELRALRDSGEEIDRDAMKAEMEANRAEMDAAMQDILTDEQWVKFEERRAEMESKREKHKDGKRWGGNDA